jgi:hypothetical protein
VFHAALVVFAAIQIHETKVALVRQQNCDGDNFNYVVCFTLCCSYGLASSHVPLKRCGGKGTLYRKVEHLLIATPGVIAVAWIVLIFYVRALYYEFG